MRLHSRPLLMSVLLAGALSGCGGDSNNPPGTVAPVSSTTIPTNQLVSPTAAPGSVYLPLMPGLKDFPNLPAGYAESEALSPDGKTLMVLTTGYNYVVNANGSFNAADSTQFLFVFDVSSGAAVQKQVVPITNTYVGMAFAPDGTALYVPGAGEDNVHIISLAGGTWSETATPIKLNHTPTSANGLGAGTGALQVTATGIAVTADGKRALVANRFNDSITVVDLVGKAAGAELDLRPGKNGGVSGTPGGEYPNSVAIVGNSTAYVSSERDREVVVLDISGAAPAIKARIAVAGNPNKMTLNKAATTLYVASDNADVVSVIDVATNVVKTSVQTTAPSGLLAAGNYKGASPNGLALSPDESTLYVTNRGTNSLAVISLTGTTPTVTGLIPTGWYPSDVRVSADGRNLYVSNAKGVPGPNKGNCLGYETQPCPVKANLAAPLTFVPNQYVLNLTGSGLLQLPVPAASTLAGLTLQVTTNNHFNYTPSAADAATIAGLRSKIQHVIYIVKENRTYDQVLGDLGQGNGDPTQTEFPQKTTPNHHALAKGFVTLDNFFDAGDVSGNGWPWSTAGRESDASAKMLPPNYAGNGGGGSYDWEGTNRNMNVGLAGLARYQADPLATPAGIPGSPGLVDADTLPGTGNVAAPDGPSGEVQQGYLWNSALRAKLTVRNYGFFADLTYYSTAAALAPVYQKGSRTPFASNVIQARASNPELAPLTDNFYRGFDTSYPDFYREAEWEREFALQVSGNSMPNLTLLRLMADHTGGVLTPDANHPSVTDGVNTPELQVADNDYAIGRVVQAVAASPYAGSTLIFVLEDDAQDGPDHVDAHRSLAYVIGPYVKQGAVVSTHYSTVNLLRTITDVLGIDHLGLIDANAAPMTDVFDLNQATWNYTATASSLLKATTLPLPASTVYAAAAKPTRTAAWWKQRLARYDFSAEDRVDTAAYNRLLWQGLMGGKSYPKGTAAARPEADRLRAGEGTAGAVRHVTANLRRARDD